MATKKLYLTQSESCGWALVTAVKGGDRPIIQLDQTLFHPQGGGQKADRGLINGVPVIHVAHNEKEVDHYTIHVDAFTVRQKVQIQIDKDWRLLNSKYHTAGHLIASLIEERFPTIQAVSGHHWPGEARVEFSGKDFPDPEKIKLFDGLVSIFA